MGKLDVDVELSGSVEDQTAQLIAGLVDVASGRRRVIAETTGDVGFQITRGLLGTSL